MTKERFKQAISGAGGLVIGVVVTATLFMLFG